MANTPHFPYPSAVAPILDTVDPSADGTQNGQFYIRTDNNNVWYWKADTSEWIQIIGQ